MAGRANQAALAKLYKSLLEEADEYEKKPEKNFTSVKEVAKIAEESAKRDAETLRKEAQARLELEQYQLIEQMEAEKKKKADEAAERARLEKEEEARLLREIEEKTKRYTAPGKFGRRIETGTVYFGDTKKSTLGAWAPHGYGEYRVKGDLRYDGHYHEGRMQGAGKLALPGGDVWDGQLRADMIHGLGSVIFADESKPKRQAIYWRNRRLCWLDELTLGTRIKFKGPHHCRANTATIIGNGSKPWKFKMRFDDEGVREMNLCIEEFRVLKGGTAKAILLDSLIGDTYSTDRYNYDRDRAQPTRSTGHEDFFADFERLEKEAAARAKEKALRDLRAREELRKKNEEKRKKKEEHKANMEALQAAVNEQERKKKEKEAEMKQVEEDVVNKLKHISDGWK